MESVEHLYLHDHEKLNLNEYNMILSLQGPASWPRRSNLCGLRGLLRFSPNDIILRAYKINLDEYNIFILKPDQKRYDAYKLLTCSLTIFEPGMIDKFSYALCAMPEQAVYDYAVRDSIYPFIG